MKSSFAVMPFMKNIRTFAVVFLILFCSAVHAQEPTQTPPPAPAPSPAPAPAPAPAPTPTPTPTPTPAPAARQAEDPNLPRMRFGMKIQPSLAWISTDSKDYESNGSEFRFAWGGVAEFKFGERYYFSTGIDVSNRGGAVRKTQTFTDSTIIIDQNIKLRYIEVPLTMKMKTNEIGYLCYYLQFGLAPGFNLKSTADVTTTTQKAGQGPITHEDEIDFDDETNFFNLSLVVGLGAEWRFSGSTTLIGGITYSNGFLDAASNNNVTLNTNYIGLTIGVLF